MVEVWFFYVISAVVIWGLNALVDKFFLSKHLNPFAYQLVYIPITLILIASILVFTPINFNSVLSYPSYVAFFAGALGVAGFYLYAFSLKSEEVSRMVALTNLYPAFVAIFAAFLVNEIFSAKIYFGIAVMLLGTVLISYKRGAFRNMIPLLLILLAIAVNIIFAFEQTISKVSLATFSFWQLFEIYLWGRVFATFAPFAVARLIRKSISELKSLKKNKIFVLVIATSAWMSASVFFFYAASLGPITLVSTISITAPFLTLLAAVLISKFWSKILKEEIDKRTVALKLLAIVLIFLGTYLITV